MTDEAKKIVYALRCCAQDWNCFECGSRCPYFNVGNHCEDKLESDAADLIERLSKELDRLKEKPLQKPLTLEEACVSKEPCVYLEMRNDRIGFRSYRAAYSGTHAAYINTYEQRENGIVYRALILDIGTLFFGEMDYDVLWRCWATKPTEEERKAAKWDD